MRKRTTKKIKQSKSYHRIFVRFSILLFVGVLFFSATTLLKNHFTTIPTCANSKSCKTDLSLQIDNNSVGIFEGKKIIPPKINSLNDTTISPVLGAESKSGEKHIYVDLSSQTLYAYQGNSLILKTYVSTGKWNPTPTGNFHIWEKLRATRMSGGEGADAYDLPNVPYVMYFYQDYGLHGAYWHDNFGHVMSHGCVNMRQVDAKVLYDWADGPSGSTLGTEVSVCDSLTQDNKCIQNNPVQ
ncbi:MAG TPA: L,D-transpeptidase [Patescibacteria group bacterium]